MTAVNAIMRGNESNTLHRVAGVGMPGPAIREAGENPAQPPAAVYVRACISWSDPVIGES